MIRPLLFLILMSPFTIWAEILHLESGELRKTLVELYTSEGCSSCPPAEKYLNKIKNNKDLWKKLIPVAFHVNYWDYLGWRDRYAHKIYGERQSQYASLKRVSTVYTPAFVVNGDAWRPGIFSSEIKDKNQKAGNLIVDLHDGNIHARYKPLDGVIVPLKINVAVLGMALSNIIERGENAGRNAEHEFVVVGYDSKISQSAEWKLQLPALHYKNASHHALAVWVSTSDNPTPIQAVGTYLKLNE